LLQTSNKGALHAGGNRNPGPRFSSIKSLQLPRSGKSIKRLAKEQESEEYAERPSAQKEKGEDLGACGEGRRRSSIRVLSKGLSQSDERKGSKIPGAGNSPRSARGKTRGGPILAGEGKKEKKTRDPQSAAEISGMYRGENGDAP